MVLLSLSALLEMQKPLPAGFAPLFSSRSEVSRPHAEVNHTGGEVIFAVCACSEVCFAYFLCKKPLWLHSEVIFAQRIHSEVIFALCAGGEVIFAIRARGEVHLQICPGLSLIVPVSPSKGKIDRGERFLYYKKTRYPLAQKEKILKNNFGTWGRWGRLPCFIISGCRPSICARCPFFVCTCERGPALWGGPAGPGAPPAREPGG